MRRHNIRDIIDGREVPPTIVTKDFTLVGTHKGSIIVEGGTATILGRLEGSFHVDPGLSAIINGTVAGSVHLSQGAKAVVHGAIEGSAHVAHTALLVVEAGGKHAGSLHNDGEVIVRGVFGGSITGRPPILEGNGTIKRPRIEDGVAIYEW